MANIYKEIKININISELQSYYSDMQSKCWVCEKVCDDKNIDTHIMGHSDCDLAETALKNTSYWLCGDDTS